MPVFTDWRWGCGLLGGDLLHGVVAARAGPPVCRLCCWPNRSWSCADGDRATGGGGSSGSEGACLTGSKCLAHASVAHLFVQAWYVRWVHWVDRVLGSISESLAAQRAIPIISKMGYRPVRSSSLSESNRLNTRRNAVPKLGPSTNIGAHSMGIGIILVTAPVTLAVTNGSTTNVWLWSFLLARELYLVLVSTRRARGRLNYWNRVSLASLNTTTLGVGPCGRMSPSNATIWLAIGSPGQISRSTCCR